MGQRKRKSAGSNQECENRASFFIAKSIKKSVFHEDTALRRIALWIFALAKASRFTSLFGFGFWMYFADRMEAMNLTTRADLRKEDAA